ncbi:MAG: pyridoxal-phosphate dependent enzyme [Acidobacteria bacterium]|nr:pyridoxal-phosphate dependent enzyme [Acidobacteriota bacterium]
MDIDSIRTARQAIAPYVPVTPLLAATALSGPSPLLLKCESMNPTRSFKVRGAFNSLRRFVASHPDPSARPPVVTASAGNHGRGMAYAAERLGVALTVFTPATAPRAKRDAIRRHGATLDDASPDYDTTEARAREFARASGGVYISPYNHPDVIAGAGTVALEIVEQCPDVGVVVVPIGGGGLASGIGVALRAMKPGCRLVAVEAAASTPFTVSLAHGRLTTIEPGPTLADGLAGNPEAESMTFPLVQQVVDEVVVVSEAELRDAMRALALEERMIVEGAAAVALAAVLSHHISPVLSASSVEPATDRPTVVVLTGANIDLDVWADVVREPRP